VHSSAPPPSLQELLVRETADSARVTSFYEPIARWCWRQSTGATTPFVIGVSGPQGAGKTTLTTALSTVLTNLGRKAITVSIDDFYLTRKEQLALASAHPGDRLLEHRGYPGTHDVELARATLSSVKAGQPTTVPVYDKSAHGGRGDRFPETAWREVSEPVDILFVEGWMLGFEPIEPAACPEPLRATNDLLAGYSVIHSLLDAFVLIEAASLDDIVGFRVDAERARRSRGETGLSDDDARDYIERFLIAYRHYVPRLRSHPPGRAAIGVVIGPERQAVTLRVLKGRESD